ncbi:MAG: aa3-type cytochrome c oxidase subunit IV [Pseudomonadota bacterium]
MADDHAEKHEHGTMNIETQEKTFAQFLSIVGRGMVICIVALILLYLVNG